MQSNGGGATCPRVHEASGSHADAGHAHSPQRTRSPARSPDQALRQDSGARSRFAGSAIAWRAMHPATATNARRHWGRLSTSRWAAPTHRCPPGTPHAAGSDAAQWTAGSWRAGAPVPSPPHHPASSTRRIRRRGCPIRSRVDHRGAADPSCTRRAPRPTTRRERRPRRRTHPSRAPLHPAHPRWTWWLYTGVAYERRGRLLIEPSRRPACLERRHRNTAGHIAQATQTTTSRAE